MNIPNNGVGNVVFKTLITKQFVVVQI